jgi:hypothetical protein
MLMDEETRHLLENRPDLLDIEIQFWENMAGSQNERVKKLKELQNQSLIQRE